MTISTLAPKFGYTDESTGVTNDRNQWNPRLGPTPCGCSSGSTDCGCPDQGVLDDLGLGRFLGPPISNVIPSTSDAQCLGHQAASGNRYAYQNGQCVLVSIATGQPVLPPAALIAPIVPVVATTVTPTVTDTIAALPSTIMTQIQTLYAQNPNVFLIGGAIALYLAFKKK